MHGSISAVILLLVAATILTYYCIVIVMHGRHHGPMVYWLAAVAVPVDFMLCSMFYREMMLLTGYWG